MSIVENCVIFRDIQVTIPSVVFVSLVPTVFIATLDLFDVSGFAWQSHQNCPCTLEALPRIFRGMIYSSTVGISLPNVPIQSSPPLYHFLQRASYAPAQFYCHKVHSNWTKKAFQIRYNYIHYMEIVQLGCQMELKMAL